MAAGRAFRRATAREVFAPCARSSGSTGVCPPGPFFGVILAVLMLAITSCATVAPGVIDRVPIALTTPGEAGSDEIGGMTVPVRFGGRDAALAIDTGSALTFLSTGEGSPEYTPRAGLVTLGGRAVELPGRNFAPDDETGAGIIGVLGAEFFLESQTEFDPARMMITRYQDGAHPGVCGWGRVPLEDVGGHIILTLMIDGRSRRLMWDTGSPHLLLVGENATGGDLESLAEDAEGGRFAIFVGGAELRVPGELARRIPALRAPEFPYFEGTVRVLGGKIDGLAGQSVFGFRRLVFSRAAGTLFVAPLDPSIGLRGVSPE